MAVDAQGFLARKRQESERGDTMTNDDYIHILRIAAVIRESFAFHTQAQRAAFTLDMEATIRGTNENWDSKLWHDACRPTPQQSVGVLKAYPFTPPAPRRVQ